ncbi:MAG: STAS domain-containing protein [Treponema sp.]|jgi:anti-sigma B factor antagonist|nr:STAS domain-containing protein [Treponema sp.]
MELSILEQDGITLIECSGELDLSGSRQLKKFFMKLVLEQKDRFIISLREVTLIDSSGVGALIFIASTVRKLELQFTFTETPERVMWLIEKIRLKSYLPFTDTLEKAAEQLGQDLLQEL